jgi:hypothetical protein
MAPAYCTTPNTAGLAVSSAATPATASHISTWSPTITPSVAASPPTMRPLLVEVMIARLPTPGIARKTITAMTNAQ